MQYQQQYYIDIPQFRQVLTVLPLDFHQANRITHIISL